MKIALVDCSNLPEPDPDREVLSNGLAAAGADATWAAWDDPAVRWSAYDLLVLRACWNYFEHADAFLLWAETHRARLLNPADVVRWNAHKGYLNELAAQGARAVPTELVPKGTPAAITEIARRRGWDRVVLKPAVSAGSFGTHRFEAAELAQGDPVLTAMSAERDMMIQPYVASVESYGERSLIWIDGQITHAMRKSPRFSGQNERVTGPLPISDDERALANAALEPFRDRILYGRADMARDDDGAPMIMELELIEPSLFLREHPPALERFVRAIVTRARIG